MSEKNQSKFDKDIELAKLSLLAEEWRNAYRDDIGFYNAALIAVLAVALTVAFQLELSGQFWSGLGVILIVGSAMIIFYYLLIRGIGGQYKKKLGKINSLIKNVEAGEPLGDFESLMTKDKGTESESMLRRTLRFGVSCLALSAILFGVQYIILYDQSVINGNTSTYVTTTVKSLSSWVDWTAGVFIAVFFGALMIGALILVIPWEQLEKMAAIRRGKKLVGL